MKWRHLSESRTFRSSESEQLRRGSLAAPSTEPRWGWESWSRTWTPSTHADHWKHTTCVTGLQGHREERSLHRSPAGERSLFSRDSCVSVPNITASTEALQGFTTAPPAAAEWAGFLGGAALSGFPETRLQSAQITDMSSGVSLTLPYKAWIPCTSSGCSLKSERYPL